MGGRQFLAKLSATLVVFLLVSDTTPVASELPPDGDERMLPASVGTGGRVGWRKMNVGRVRVENEEGDFLVAGLSVRSLRSRSRLPSPPPAPHRSPGIIPSPPPRPPTSPIHHHHHHHNPPPPRPCTPPPFEQ